jgi:hypothetical protein
VPGNGAGLNASEHRLNDRRKSPVPLYVIDQRICVERDTSAVLYLIN